MKYRVKFSKNGPIKYIGHLDVMRYFQKAIRRAQLPIAYSEGFSPHQILSFAFPLSVGFTSEGEYFDMEMTDEVNEDEILDSLNLQMADGIEIVCVRKLPDKAPNCMASVFAAEYKILFENGEDFIERNKERIVDFFGQSTIAVNKPKKKGGGFVEIDLSKFIYEFSYGKDFIDFIVNAGSSDNIKPDFVVECLFEYLSMDISETDYDVKRIEIFANSSDEEIKLTRLIDY